MKRAIYPGTFDPFTNGHLDILCRASEWFDEVVVALLNNSAKQPVFSLAERYEMIEAAARQSCTGTVVVREFHGLLVDFAREQDAQIVIRGLRALTDFEYEIQMAHTNKQLAPDIEMIFMMADLRYSYVSSSIVREIGRLGGDIDNMIPAVNRKRIVERLRET